MLDLTLVSCNYNTPQHIQTMLRSWAFHNSEVSHNCLIMEHSTNEDSINFYVDNSIPYIRNRGAVHYKGVESAFHLVNTKYMLLVDSDVVFHKSLEPILTDLISANINLAGRVEGDRGGFLLHKRVHPWYCLIDIEFANRHSIRYVDMNRVNSTNSQGFYSNIPINEYENIRKYDVGSTFLEDVLSHNGRVFNHNIEGEYFTHYEGVSWRASTGIPKLIEANDVAFEQFKVEFDKYSDINVKGFYNGR